MYTTLLHKILRQYLWERSLTTSFHCGIWTARSARVRHSCWGESVILFKIFTFWFLYCINIYHSIEKKANQNTGNPLYILSITHNHLIMGCADVPLMTAFGMEWYEIVMQCSFMVNASVYTKKINTNQLGRKVYKYSKSLSATVSEIGVECYTSHVTPVNSRKTCKFKQILGLDTISKLFLKAVKTTSGWLLSKKEEQTSLTWVTIAWESPWRVNRWLRSESFKDCKNNQWQKYEYITPSAYIQVYIKLFTYILHVN